MCLIPGDQVIRFYNTLRGHGCRVCGSVRFNANRCRVVVDSVGFCEKGHEDVVIYDEG